MQHYFIDKEHSETDFFEFNDSVLDLELCFRSCDSIFSKNKIDDGTRALLNAIEKKCNLNGKGLDLGCGLGVIAIALIKTFGVTFDMVDINNTAVKLSKENLIKNNVGNCANVFYSDGFSTVNDNYDFIVTNPPIKTGKKLLFELMNGAYEHLKDNGKL
ncbi:MAG: methyltransferase, partial [Clostridia bacterium]|nr:methyltransferase [Clostridia bacterium]